MPNQIQAIAVAVVARWSQEQRDNIVNKKRTEGTRVLLVREVYTVDEAS